MKTYALICSHNGINFINDQVNSILNQTSSIDFLYIFDFNSTDGTREIIVEISKNNPKVFAQFYNYALGAKHSFFKAFEYIINISRNEDYIFISDQDDVWVSTKVEILKSEILKHNDETFLLLFHDVMIASSNLEVISNSFYTDGQFLIPRDLTIDRLMLSNCIIGHTMVVSRNLLSMVVENANADQYLMHDWTIALYASALGKIIFIPLKLSFYRQHAKNLIGAHGEQNIKSIIAKSYTFPNSVINQSFTFHQEMNKLERNLPPISIFTSEKSNLIIFRILNFPFDSFKFIPISFFAVIRGGTIRKKLIGFLVLNAGLINLMRKVWRKRKFIL